MRWIVVAALVLGACAKSDDAPPCAAVVDNMIAVTKQQMSSHGGMELQNRKAMIDQCEQRKMPAEQRRCLAAAKDLTGIAGCTKQRPAK
jgi:hypothetical protein